MLGDFVKGRPGAELSNAVRAGIYLHRRIDVYTDAHPVHRRSRQRFAPSRRRFAGIIVDICYDHFLSQRWSTFSDEPLGLFTGRVYAVLAGHLESLPGRLRRIAPRMIEQDWLGSYGDIESVGLALDGVSRRLKRRNPLAGSLSEVQRNYGALAADFEAFFPDLVRFADEQRSIGRG